jgi:hypothetical protein
MEWQQLYAFDLSGRNKFANAIKLGMFKLTYITRNAGSIYFSLMRPFNTKHK